MKVVKTSSLRTQGFRKMILEHYNYKCIVSNTSNLAQLEAAHILPLKWMKYNTLDKNRNINDKSNGILLNRNLHKTFDEYYWSINPNTQRVEVNSNIKLEELGNIINYNGNKLPFKDDPYFLIKHYRYFLNLKYMSCKK